MTEGGKEIFISASFAESLIHFRGNLIQDFLRLGYRVNVCAPDISPKVRAILEGWGCQVYRINLLRNRINLIADFIYLFKILLLLKKIKPDIFFAYTAKPVIYGLVAARLSGVKQRFALITGLGYLFRPRWWLMNWLGKNLYRFSLKFASKVFFQNPDDCELFISSKILLDKSITAVINGSGVDVEKFSISPFPSKIKFLLIARLLKSKGICEYVAAACVLRSKYPDLEFHLVGWIDGGSDAISEQDLEGWIQSKVIIYHGKLDDVRECILNCSVYVLPSYREGTPRTVLEAMAMGRPVITTDVPGCRETVINGKNGLLVKACSSEELAIAMELFVLKQELIPKYGLESRKIAVEKYDVKIVNLHLMFEMGLL